MQFGNIVEKKTIIIGAAAFIAGAVIFSGCTRPEWDDPSAYNSDHFDLTRWKIALPVPDDKGKALEVKNLKGYESQYFYDAKDGAMVFFAPVEGSVTKNTKYPRSELRERENGKDSEWTLSGGGTMTATLKVNEAPKDSHGKPGKMVIGQIHGEDNELVRLYWDNDTVYFHNDLSGDDNKEHEFLLKDMTGNTPKISLNEQFSYKIEAYGDRLAVTVYADGEEYTSVTPINTVWQTDKLYFKAGVYLGVNAKQKASGAGKVSFYALDYGHTQGSGLGGLQR